MNRLHHIEITTEGRYIAIIGKYVEDWSLTLLHEAIDELGDIRYASAAIAENAPPEQRYLAMEAYEQDCERERLAYCAFGLLRAFLAPETPAEMRLVRSTNGPADDESKLERIARAQLELGCKFRGDAPPGCDELL